MKYFTFLISFLFVINVQAQCPPGNVDLDSQEEVDQFILDFPNCTDLSGWLNISSGLVNDISGLSFIQSVEDGFDVTGTNCPIIDFPKLNSIGGLISIYDNALLTELNLPALSAPVEYFDITYNPILNNVQLCELQSVHFLSIWSNPNLSSLCLDQLKVVDGDLAIENTKCSTFDLFNLSSINGNLFVQYNDQLTELILPNLTGYVDYFDITSNPLLSDIQACSLNSVNCLSIWSNPNLSSLCVENLTSSDGDVSIKDTKLVDINTLSKLLTVGSSFSLTDNALLTNCDGICPLLFNNGVGSSINIYNNPSACSSQVEVEATCVNLSECPTGDVVLNSQADVDQFLLDFPYCIEIEGSLSISSELVKDISGLSSLLSIDGNLNIENTNCTNINFIDLSSINGNITIANNSLLTELEFENITSFASDISITNNLILKSLRFCALSFINGDLLINTNKELSSLCLNQLTHVGASMYLYQTNLSHLNTFNSLQFVGSDFSLIDHPNLFNCSGICSLIDNDGIGGSIHISENPSGCSSQLEIEAFCASLFDCPPGSVDFSTQAEIEQFMVDYPNCVNLRGGLRIDSDNVNDISGLSAIETINGNLDINYTSLSKLNFPNLVGVTGNIYIDDNLLLLEAGFPNLSYRVREVNFFFNDELKEIQFCSLKSVDGDFYLIANSILLSICFDDLTTIGGSFDLSELNVSDINTFENLMRVDGDFYLGYNYNLSNCEGICPLLNNNGVGGNLTITENATGCDSQTEAENACPAIFPIELVEFKASEKHGLINLSWMTANEINNRGFVIQSSQNGIDWNAIDFVNGKGNTIEESQYDYNGIIPFNGMNFFRLKQMDFDESIEFSNVITIEYKDSKSGLNVFPNPSNGQMKLQLNMLEGSSVHLRITDILGKTIWEHDLIDTEPNWSNEIFIDVSGVYQITAQIGSEILTQQVIVVSEN